jgi:autotransporter-associated beta strand protein
MIHIRHILMIPKYALRSFLLGSSLLASTASSLLAQTSGTYTSQTGAWNVTGSWESNIIATGAGSTAFFTNDVTTSTRTTSLGANRTIGNITFTDADNSAGNGFDRIISGNTLTLDVTTGAPIIDVTQANRSLTIGSLISGNKGLTKQGSGTLILTNTAWNNYTGATNINGGTLQIGDGTTAGGGLSNTNSISIGTNAVLAINKTENTGQGGGGLGLSGTPLTGNGSLRMIGAGGTGMLSLTVANTYTGGTTLDAGTLRLFNVGTAGVSSSIGTGTLTINGGSLDAINTATVTLADKTNNAQAWNGNFTFIGTNNLNMGTGAVTMNATRTVTTTAKILTIGGAIDDGVNTYGLTKAGAGTLELSGTNTYGGATTISGGLLTLNNPLALQNSTLDTTNSIASSNASTGLQISGTSLTLGGLSGNKNLSTLFNAANGYTSLAALTLNPGTGATASYSGDIGTGNGSLTLTKTGAGTQTLSGTNTYGGATTVSAGTLYVTGALSNSAVTVEANGTIGRNGASNGGLGNGLTIAAEGNIDLTGATLGTNSLGILGLTGGNLTLGKLTFGDLLGWNAADAALGTYELIEGGFAGGLAFGSTEYLSVATAFDFENGKFGYFTADGGSLNAIIIPEPNAATLIGAFGMLALLRRRN